MFTVSFLARLLTVAHCCPSLPTAAHSLPPLPTFVHIVRLCSPSASFFANRAGAHALLANTSAAHVRMLCQWLRFGRMRSSSPSTAAAGARHTKDALQSEAFTPYWLSLEAVSVVRWPFERTDVRFESEREQQAKDESRPVGVGAPNHTRPCVRPLYYDCGPAILHERKLLPMCQPEASERDRQLWKKWNHNQR
jgi:hypothetical protein